MSLRNLTPHPVRIYHPDTPDRVDDNTEPDTVLPVDGTPVRIATVDLGLQPTNVGPVAYVEYRHINDLPPHDDGVWLLVPLVVALACRPRRDDLLVPYREVRNQQGTVVGCRGLAKPV